MDHTPRPHEVEAPRFERQGLCVHAKDVALQSFQLETSPCHVDGGLRNVDGREIGASPHHQLGVHRHPAADLEHPRAVEVSVGYEAIERPVARREEPGALFEATIDLREPLQRTALESELLVPVVGHGVTGPPLLVPLLNVFHRVRILSMSMIHAWMMPQLCSWITGLAGALQGLARTGPRPFRLRPSDPPSSERFEYCARAITVVVPLLREPATGLADAPHSGKVPQECCRTLDELLRAEIEG